MRNRHLILIDMFLLILVSPAQASEIQWQNWRADLFEQAQRENRFVIFDLEAVWCHWCHVMEEKTYADATVIELIKDKYIAVRADQDASPELAARYGDYGWPATIVFAPDGSEIVKRRGYINPPAMQSLLQAIIDDPSPGPSIVAQLELKAGDQTSLTQKQKSTLEQAWLDAYDKQHGGWGQIHKYLDRNRIELALIRAREGDEQSEMMARKSLDQSLKLIDPIWGGIYQYSDKLDWSSPHFEKIMSFQADALHTWSLAYAWLKDPKYKTGADAIYRYLVEFFMARDGGFYVSQDADLNEKVDGHQYYKLSEGERRSLGMPRVDKNRYARENGWAISALADYYSYTGNGEALNYAILAANWITKHRGLDSGGFRHNNKDEGQFLSSTLGMLDAFLQLYTVTGEADWLARAEAAAGDIDTRFRAKDGGYLSALPGKIKTGAFSKPTILMEENVSVARQMNRLHHYIGDDRWKSASEYAMRLLATDAVINNKPWLVEILLADREINQDPVHITVVGEKSKDASGALFRAAISYPGIYRRIEWWDKTAGPLPNPDVRYPQLSRPAAFACADNACSLPVFQPSGISRTVERLMAAQ